MRSVLAVNVQQLFLANDRRTVGLAHFPQSQRVNFLGCHDHSAVAGVEKPYPVRPRYCQHIGSSRHNAHNFS